MFSKTEKNEMIKALIRENARIKYENDKLRKFLEDTKECREKYKEMVNDMSNLKRRYEEGIEELAHVREECRKKLDKIIKETIK